MQHIHALTPGDHFSPLTGSAIATVVDGLSQHTQPRPRVLVARGTYPDRYSSADIIEYELRKSPYGAPRRVRGTDVLCGRMGLPRPWARSVYRQLLEKQDQWQPSYLFAHNAPQLIPLIKGLHIPVLYAHNNLLDWYGSTEARKTLAAAQHIIAVSDYTARRIADKVPSMEGRLRVVHNGVDLSAFSSPRAESVGGLRVGFVGRLIPGKGAHTLVQAVRRLNRSDIELTVVGSAGFSAGPRLTDYEQGLRRAAAGLRVPVQFIPFQPRSKIPQIFAGFDVVVVPSIEAEAFALTVLEGMASGAAVVASDIGGVAEAAGGAGRLVAPGDVDELATALEGLAESPKLVAQMARKGRARAERQTWRHSAERLQEVLESGS